MSKKAEDRGKCFCCRRPLTSNTTGPDRFTEEHYIPQWVFKRHRLRQQTMDLPTKSEIAYGSLWVPCCKACNERLNKELEGSVRPLILDGQPQTWTAADLDLVKRWLAKVYLGVRVRASTLHVDPKDANSPTIASQKEIDGAEMLRMVVRGQMTIPHSSLFVYDCDPTSPAGEDFDFYANDEVTVVAMRTGSVGLVCILLDGQSVENYATTSHPLVKAQTEGPLDKGRFRMAIAYGLAGALSADVQPTMETAGTGNQKTLTIGFTAPQWHVPDKEIVQAWAATLAATVGMEVEWVEQDG